jgi:hypothetical protein
MELSSLTSPIKDSAAKPDDDRMFVHAVLPIPEKQLLDSTRTQNPGISLQVMNDPLQLVYKAVTSKMQEGLRITPTTDHNQLVADLELTPEITAHKLASYSALLYAMYSSQDSSTDTTKLVHGFSKILRSAIEEGFEEARKILTDLRILDQETDRSVSITYTLTQKYLIDLRANNYIPV